MRFVETPVFTASLARHLEAAAFYMLYCYAKNEQGDLTSAQAKALGRLVREEFT